MLTLIVLSSDAAAIYLSLKQKSVMEPEKPLIADQNKGCETLTIMKYLNTLLLFIRSCCLLLLFGFFH
jgi:hypothetical protein